MSEDFSKNLRALCARFTSVSAVCREIGINRQQFNRYLNGSGLPSAYNLRRIAGFFSIAEAELLLPHDAFYARHIRQNKITRRVPEQLIGDVFRDQARGLRRYLGFYHGHFRTPTWEGGILRTLIWLREQDGYVVTHSFERATDANGNIRQRTRYSGLAAYRGNRIYIFERAFSDDGFLSETILYPAHRQQIVHIKGLTTGVATRPRLAPFSSPTIWKRIGNATSARDAVSKTGVYPTASSKIEPQIRRFLTENEGTLLT